MRPKNRPLAFLIALVLSFLPQAVAAKIYNKHVVPQPYAKVVSANADISGNLVLLTTAAQRKLPLPAINYLPGPDGLAIMSVDFPDTIFCAQPATFHFVNTPIKQVHIGQFQAAPPIVRICLTAKSTASFKQVAFQSKAGSLIIKLPPGRQESTYRHISAVPPIQYTVPAPLPTVALQPAPLIARSISPKPFAAPAYPLAVSPEPIVTSPATQPAGLPLAPVGAQRQASAVHQLACQQAGPQLPGHQHMSLAPQPAPEFVTEHSLMPKLAPMAESTMPLTAPTSDPNAPRLRGPIELPAPASNPPNALASKSTAMTPAHNVAHNIENTTIVKSTANAAKPHFLLPFFKGSAGISAVSSVHTEAGSTAIADQAATAMANIPNTRMPASRALQVQIEGIDPITVKLVTDKLVQVSTFRLHDPERYVIDLTGTELDQRIDDGNLPEVPDNPWLKSIRLGAPAGDAQHIQRIVLDLYTADVSITSTADKANLASAFTSAAFTLQNNAAQTAMATGIPVPNRLPTGFSVVLDAGHGGSDPGAQRGDVQEKELTLSIVEKLKKQLESRGIKVLLTRDNDTFVSLEDRVKMTNANQPSAFVSVHINAMETNTATQGIETYFQNDRSKDLAQLIHESLIKELQAPDHCVRKARFYVINHTPLPAVLAEVGFISNKEERSKLISSDYQKHIASALADGVMLYLATCAQGRFAGTIAALPASALPSAAATATKQSFTQNLHSHNNEETSTQRHKSLFRRAKHGNKADKKLKAQIARQSLKFNRNRLASRRS